MFSQSWRKWEGGAGTVERAGYIHEFPSSEPVEFLKLCRVKMVYRNETFFVLLKPGDKSLPPLLSCLSLVYFVVQGHV